MKVYVYPIAVVKFDVPDKELDLGGLSELKADQARLDWIEHHANWYQMFSSMKLPPGAEYAGWSEEHDGITVLDGVESRAYDRFWRPYQAPK